MKYINNQEAHHRVITFREEYLDFLKKFCVEYHNSCEYLSDNYLECPSICEKIASELVKFLLENINMYLHQEEADVDGEYPLIKLFKLSYK